MAEMVLIGFIHSNIESGKWGRAKKGKTIKVDQMSLLIDDEIQSPGLALDANVSPIDTDAFVEGDRVDTTRLGQIKRCQFVVLTRFSSRLPRSPPLSFFSSTSKFQPCFPYGVNNNRRAEEKGAEFA